MTTVRPTPGTSSLPSTSPASSTRPYSPPACWPIWTNCAPRAAYPVSRSSGSPATNVPGDANGGCGRVSRSSRRCRPNSRNSASISVSAASVETAASRSLGRVAADCTRSGVRHCCHRAPARHADADRRRVLPARAKRFAGLPRRRDRIGSPPRPGDSVCDGGLARLVLHRRRHDCVLRPGLLVRARSRHLRLRVDRRLRDRSTKVPGALILAACVTSVGVFVFSRMLQVPFPVLQWGPA